MFMLIGYYEGNSDILDTATSQKEAATKAEKFAREYGEGWTIEWVRVS